MHGVIAAEGLMRRFGDLLAVDGLSLRIEAGEIFGFLGHNGAGKTTTVRLLNGVLAPSAGSAQVLGLDPAVDGPAVRRQTGVLTETPSLDDRLTARRILRLFAAIYGVPQGEIDRRVALLLDRFGLAERADDKVGGYSRGMRQRLALARTLLHDPKLLFLDEPTAGLDPAAAREVQQMILHLSRSEGHTIFLCTHNLVEAQRLCDRVAVLAAGRPLAVGTPAELAAHVRPVQRLALHVGAGQVGRLAALLDRWPSAALVTQPDEPHDPDRARIQGIGREETPSLVRALTEAGIDLYSLTPEEATLEDVYFALT